VNNLISHPPHPRRAVPANLPPGAFFIFLKVVGFFYFCFFIASCPLFSGVEQSSLRERIEELKAKSSAHSRYVSEVLSDLDFSGDSLPQPRNQAYPLNRQPPSDHTEDFSLVQESVNADQISESQNSADRNELDDEFDYNSSMSKESSYVSYSNLYHKDKDLRANGIYVGPLLGLSFPSDSSVILSSQSNFKYKADSGYFLGFRIGNDFGSTRIEADYNFLNYDISDSSSAGDVSTHNLMGRFILEKGLGRRLDLRAGLGMGLAVVEKNLDGETFQGNGFAYDFLLGFSIRIMENWSLVSDYRYFITAAHKNYDRVQSHLFELSSNFDL